MSDENISVGITVTSDQAEAGAKQASGAVTGAVRQISEQMNQLIASSQQATAAMVGGFDRLGMAVQRSSGIINSSVRGTADVVVAASRRVQSANGEESASHERLGHSARAARRELVVMLHELATGNYSRLGGSLMVLGERMDWMSKIMSPVGLSIGVIAGSIAIAAGVTYKAAMAMANYGDAIQKTAQITGASTDSVQQWVFAAQASGVSARETVEAFSKLGDVQNKATHGNKEAAAAFAAIGISLGALRENSPTDLLAKIADAFHASSDGAAKAAVANTLFGASGESLIPLLDRGSAGLAQLGVEARNAGAIIGNDTIKQMAGLKEQMELAHAKMDAMSMSAKAVLLPTIINLTAALSDNAGLKPILIDFYTDVGAVVKGAASAIATLVVGAEQAGDAISTVATMANRAAMGDFSGTVEAAKAGFHSIETEGEHYAKFMQKIWSDAAPPTPEQGATGNHQINFSKGGPRQRAETPMRDYSLQNAQTQATLNTLKETLKEQQSELDRAYKGGEVSLRGYYSQRLQITLAGMKAEADAVRQQLAQTKSLESSAATPAERISMKTKEIELTGRLTVMEQQRAAAVQQSSQEELAAEQTQQKALEDLAVRRTQMEVQEANRRALMVAQEEQRQGEMTKAQVLALEQQQAQQESALAIQALQQRLDTERTLTVQARQQIEDQIAQIQEQSETKQTQLAIQAQQEQTQSAQQGAQTIENDFTKAFSSFADGTKTAKSAFTQFLTEIDSMLTQLVAKQLFQQLFQTNVGGMGSAQSLLTSGLGMLFGGFGQGAFSGAGAFGFSSGLAGSTDAVMAGMGAASGGSEGMSALMGLASFAVGTPYVPHDMVAQIHQGEAIVPAHLNSPFSGGNVSVSNQFVLPNGVDLRTQSQIASMAGGAISVAMKRNG